jgi:hypothetical protein
MINQREKERLSKKANRHIETWEECAKRKKTTSDCMSRKRQMKLMSKAQKARRLIGTVR